LEWVPILFSSLVTFKQPQIVWLSSYGGKDVAVKYFKQETATFEAELAAVSLCQLYGTKAMVSYLPLNILSVLTYIKVEVVGYDPASRTLVLEYMNMCSLQDFLGTSWVLPPQLIIRFAHQIVLGMIELHSRQIIHRDLKPANILLRDDCGVIHLKLGGNGNLVD